MERKIKTLKSNNGGEYTSKAFKDFCAGVGIKRELIVLYNPQQNGVAERKNMAIVGVAKEMLYDQDLPKFLWEEACNTAVYIQNKSSHSMLGRKTLEEVFTGKKSEVGQFRIFGYLVYCHVPSEKRTKLEATAEKGIFVGYNEISKAYRVYIPALRKTIIRRDVKFEENRALKKAHDIVSAAIGDQELETQKDEETQVTGTGVRTSEHGGPSSTRYPII
jgi:hypothetical protein